MAVTTSITTRATRAQSTRNCRNGSRKTKKPSSSPNWGSFTPKDMAWVKRIQLFHWPTVPEAAIRAITREIAA